MDVGLLLFMGAAIGMAMGVGCRWRLHVGLRGR